MIRGLLLFFFLAVSPCAQAQTLSESEQAAASQRKSTGAERSLRKQGCKLKASASQGSLKPAQGVTADVVILPAQRFLIVSEMATSSQKGKFDIRQPRPLPNGGIAGKDFCASHQIFNIARPKPGGGHVVQWLGLRLRTNLDLARAYPNTSKAIKRQKQILTTPAGRYAVLESKKTREAAFWKRSGAGWGNSLGSRIAFEADGKYYIHLPN